jgi:osmotically-inducible protein OsmY
MRDTSNHSWQRSLAVRLILGGMGVSGMTVTMVSARAIAQTTVNSESMHQENLSAHSVESHHYASPADRARDALLIVKVKAAIADEGLADNYPLTVDADHGRVTLTGVLASPQDVRRAVTLVARIDGVTGVNNRLTWQKGPQ